MYTVIALFHSSGIANVVPVFTTAKNLARAVAVAREARDLGYDLGKEYAGVYIFQIQPETVYKSWDFWHLEDTPVGYPCICRFYKCGKKLAEDWNDKKAKKRYSKRALKKNSSRAPKRKKS